MHWLLILLLIKCSQTAVTAEAKCAKYKHKDEMPVKSLLVSSFSKECDIPQHACKYTKRKYIHIHHIYKFFSP